MPFAPEAVALIETAFLHGEDMIDLSHLGQRDVVIYLGDSERLPFTSHWNPLTTPNHVDGAIGSQSDVRRILAATPGEAISLPVVGTRLGSWLVADHQ
eukprot:10010117-Heterocapsa_arctica.AAC.1